MVTVKIFFVFLFVQQVMSDGDPPRVIDPLFQSLVDTFYIPDQFWVKYKNITITGLNNRQVIANELLKYELGVSKKYKTNLKTVGDVTFEFRKQRKSFSGLFTLVTDLTYIVEYILEKEYSPEQGALRTRIDRASFKCEDVGDPQITIGSNLEEAFKQDPEFVNFNPKLDNIKEFRKQLICVIGAVTFNALVDSYYDVARITPADDFLQFMLKP